MSIYGITMVKNEQDVIGSVIEHLFAEGVDRVLVADNASTDRTRAILEELAARLPVTIVDDPEPGYFQAAKMNRLAVMAREQGAEWIVPFDADELWVASTGSLAAALVASDDADALVADWFDHYASPFARGGVFERMRWRSKHAHPQRKVAFRPLLDLTLRQGNHGVDCSRPLREVAGRIVVHHYRYRSFRHFVEKNRNGKRAMDAGGDALRSEWSEHWRVNGGRSDLRLLLTWAKYHVTAARGGTVRDPVRPSHLAR